MNKKGLMLKIFGICAWLVAGSIILDPNSEGTVAYTAFTYVTLLATLIYFFKDRLLRIWKEHRQTLLKGIGIYVLMAAIPFILIFLWIGMYAIALLLNGGSNF